MIPKCYATNPIGPNDRGFTHSRTIMSAFSEGCGGPIVSPRTLLEGPAAMYGILRGTGEIMQQCSWIGRDYYYIDHGYMNPGHYEGYYRVTKNGRQAAIPDDKENIYSPDRLNKLGITPRPWKRRGDTVVVIPLTGAVSSYYGIKPDLWLDAVLTELAQHTDRPVIVKEKGTGDIGDYLRDAWCLITHSSNTAVDAIISGVPAVTLGESACEAVSWSMGDIEAPHWPDRDWWLRALAYQQFTLPEMKSGLCWEYINDH